MSGRHPKPREADVADASLFAVVLAAGTASRYGSVKQLDEYRGLPLVAHALRNAEAVCGRRSLLVTGCEWQAVIAACRPVQGYFVRFEGYAAGIGASIACGARSIAGSAGGMLLVLADQVLVTAEHLEIMAKRWAQSPRSIVASGYAGAAGPPVVFPADCFGRLARLEGDRGAREILEQEKERVVTIPYEPAAVDIDRPEELERLRRLHGDS